MQDSHTLTLVKLRSVFKACESIFITFIANKYGADHRSKIDKIMESIEYIAPLVTAENEKRHIVTAIRWEFIGVANFQKKKSPLR